MSEKKYTLDEIRKDPELKNEVCNPEDVDNQPSTSGGDGILDMFFDGIDAAADIVLDGIDTTADIVLDGIDAATGGTSKKSK